MKNFTMRAAGMLAGVRMLRCAIMLVLLAVTVSEVRAQVVKELKCKYCSGINYYQEGKFDKVDQYEYQFNNTEDSRFKCIAIFICVYCNKPNQQYVHDVTKRSTFEPTCTEDGGEGGICNRCGIKDIRVITKHRLGHDWGEKTYVWPTCTTPGYYIHTCKRCSSSEDIPVIDYDDPHYYDYHTLGHDMSWTTVAATCTTGGYEHGHCQRSSCNYEKTRNETPALGHNFALNHHCTRCDAVDPAKQPEGYIDHCAGGELQFSIRGWAYDANVPATSIDIHVYVYQNDGTTQYGNIHIIHADMERPDLATNRGIPTNHGYSATIPIADAGTYKVKAYAIDLNGDGNPQIGATQTVTVTSPSYIAADGTKQIANNATQLTGGGNFPKLPAGWYYVTGEVNYTSLLTLQGDANIILCDGSTLNIGSNDTRLTHCIKGGDYTLTIYGQSKQTGTLNAYSRNAENVYVANFNMMGGNINLDCISNYNAALLLGTEGTGTLTQKRGNLNVTTTAKQGVIRGNVDFRGGQLAANGGYGIKGTVNISWSSPDDRFRTSSFGKNDDKTAIIASGKAFTDGTNYYTGTLNSSEKGSLHDITLWPVTAISLSDNASNSTAVTKLNGVTNLDVTLSDRTLYKDGAWNTLCLPFDVTTTSGPLSGDGLTAMTLNTATSGFTNGTLTLNFDAAPATIPAGTPFIIKWNNMGTTIEEPEFTGVTISNATNNANSSNGKVTFKGTYAPMTFTEENKSILFLSTANTLYYPKSGASIKAQRAYFQLNGITAGDPTSPVKEFILNFGEEDSETSLTPALSKGKGDGAVYDLSGRKVANCQLSTNLSSLGKAGGGRQLPKGIYIVNGKKILK